MLDKRDKSGSRHHRIVRQTESLFGRSNEFHEVNRLYGFVR